MKYLLSIKSVGTSDSLMIFEKISPISQSRAIHVNSTSVLSICQHRQLCIQLLFCRSVFEMTITDFPYSANDDAETLAVPLYLIVTLEPVGGESSNLSPISTNLYIENSANDDVETLAVTRGDESSFGTIRLCLNHSLGFGRSLTFLSKTSYPTTYFYPLPSWDGVNHLNIFHSILVALDIKMKIGQEDGSAKKVRLISNQNSSLGPVKHLYIPVWILHSSHNFRCDQTWSSYPWAKLQLGRRKPLNQVYLIRPHPP